MGGGGADDWKRVLSLRYRAPAPIPEPHFLGLIGAIGEAVGQQLEDTDGEFVFPAEVDGVPCMCAVVPVERERITACRFLVLTRAPQPPRDLTALDPVHQLIEDCFVAA